MHRRCSATTLAWLESSARSSRTKAAAAPDSREGWQNQTVPFTWKPPKRAVPNGSPWEPNRTTSSTPYGVVSEKRSPDGRHLLLQQAPVEGARSRTVWLVADATALVPPRCGSQPRRARARGAARRRGGPVRSRARGHDPRQRQRALAALRRGWTTNGDGRQQSSRRPRLSPAPVAPPLGQLVLPFGC